MKHKISKLEAALLDAAVAKAQGRPIRFNAEAWGGFWQEYRERPVIGWAAVPPCSTDWMHGGPIIERERILPIAWERDNGEVVWTALVGPGSSDSSYEVLGPDFHGPSGRKLAPTPLIAAMRAYVASKFGEEVELP